MNLSEVLNTNPYEWRVTENKFDSWKAEFDVYEDNSRIILSSFIEDKESQTWQLAFIRYKLNSKSPEIKDSTGVWNDNDINLTLKIFSTLKDMVSKYLETRKPVNFYFSSDGQSRTKLYNRFADQISNRFKYKMKKKNSEGITIYEFSKKD